MLITPYEGSQPLGGKNDVFNYHSAKSRQVVERAFGMMISRWRILVDALGLGSHQKDAVVIKVCCLFHNICLRHNLSKKIVVNAADQHKTNRPAAYQLRMTTSQN
jgi:hypothetical protein